MRKFIWPGVAAILVLGFIAIGMTNTTDVRTSMGQGALWSTEVENLDGSGNLSIYGNVTAGGALAVTGATTFGGDITVSDDNLIYGTGVAVATTTTSGSSQGTIMYAYLGGIYDATEGAVLVATVPAAEQGITVIRANASQDKTGAVGIAASAVSTGSIVGFYTSGYVLALTTGTVNPGDTLVVSDLGTSGYLEADTTPTTGADVGVALGYGVTAGGLVKILLYR